MGTRVLKEIFDNGTVYDGSFDKEGLWDGVAVVTLRDGSTLSGEFKKGFMVSDKDKKKLTLSDVLNAIKPAVTAANDEPIKAESEVVPVTMDEIEAEAAAKVEADAEEKIA